MQIIGTIWKSFEILRKSWESSAVRRSHGNPLKSLEIYVFILEILENHWKSLEIIGNPCKSLETLENPQKSSEIIGNVLWGARVGSLTQVSANLRSDGMYPCSAHSVVAKATDDSGR